MLHGVKGHTDSKSEAQERLGRRMAAGKFRFTRQRREVYDALLGKRDHPTAVEVFLRVKDQMPTISLATVYNCLETLTQCGLVRQVNLDRAPSRYCPNNKEHAHFHCEDCGKVVDVDLPDTRRMASLWQLPKGSVLHHQELSLKGLCPACARRHNSAKN